MYSSVTDGEFVGAGATGAHGVREGRYVAYSDAATASLPRTGAFPTRPTSGIPNYGLRS